MRQTTAFTESPELIGIVIAGPRAAEVSRAEAAVRPLLAYVWGPPPEPALEAVAEPRAA